MSDRTKWPKEIFVMRYIQAEPAEEEIAALKRDLAEALDEGRRLKDELESIREEYSIYY